MLVEDIVATKADGAANPWGRRAATRTFSFIWRILREPLTQFVLGGLVLFALSRIYNENANTYRIVVTPSHVRQIERDYALQFGSLPDAPTLGSLLREDLHDEVLYRQGLLLKLDQDDQIVRRRVVQKMQFLMQDLNPPAEPTPAQLAAYYKAHAKQYVVPAQATFSHVYFSPGVHGDADAKARAQAALVKLENGKLTRAPDAGDPFPDLYDFSNYEPEQVFRLFGHTPFSAAVFAAPVGHWVGPYRSGYGWHLIYVDARAPARQPGLAKVHDAVRSDYLRDAQDKANKAAFQALAKKFTIVDGTKATAP